MSFLQTELQAQGRQVLLWMLYCNVQNGDGSKASKCYDALKAAAAETDALECHPPALASFITALTLQAKLRVRV